MFQKLQCLKIIFVSMLLLGLTTTLWATVEKLEGSELAQADSGFELFNEFPEDVAIQERPSDPLYYYNVSMFKFNDFVYSYVLFPVTTVYSLFVPKPMRHGVGNFFYNVAFPIRFLSSLAQGRFRRAGTELSRFGINTTVGVLGLFDPATHWLKLPRHTENFGQTFGRYGIPSGPYLVLPFLGPSTLRDSFGTVIDSFLNPINRMGETEQRLTLNGVDIVNSASTYGGEYRRMKEASIDFYAFMQDAYLQRQKQLIAD